MKKLTLTFSIALALGATVFAGDSKDKEIMQQAPTPTEWYRAHEWDLDLWGAFAFSQNTGDRLPANFDPDHHVEGTGIPPGAADPNEDIDLGAGGSGYLFGGRNNVWGGGADVKYFFSKWWGLGVEGLILDAERNIAGSGFGTFTFRFPIGNTRFAPYAFGGLGVTAGGSRPEWFRHERNRLVPVNGVLLDQEIEFDTIEGNANNRSDLTGQAGVGLEVRITPRIGVMSDFAWNVVDGPSNNFGLTRFGVTLSY